MCISLIIYYWTMHLFSWVLEMEWYNLKFREKQLSIRFCNKAPTKITAFQLQPVKVIRKKNRPSCQNIHDYYKREAPFMENEVELQSQLTAFLV